MIVNTHETSEACVLVGPPRRKDIKRICDAVAGRKQNVAFLFLAWHSGIAGGYKINQNKMSSFLPNFFLGSLHCYNAHTLTVWMTLLP